MSEESISERPLGIYLVSLYFVLAGFLESIQKYREWNAPLSVNPFADHSVWELLVHTIIYLGLALLVWNFVSLGRLAALVYGYLTLGTYIFLVPFYWLYDGEIPLSVTPLYISIGIFHVTTLIPVIAYLQPKRQKKLFRVSLLELLFSTD